MNIIIAGVTAALLLIAWRTSTVSDPRIARRCATLGISWTILALGPVLGMGLLHMPDASIHIGNTAISLLGSGHSAFMPFVCLLVGVIAVALAPVASHGAGTLSSVVQLIAISVAFLSIREPLALLALWGLSIVVMVRSLEPGRSRRALVRYLSLSFLLAAVGSGALFYGNAAIGGIAWLVAIAVRQAVTPFHGWLPALGARAPMALVVAFCGPQIGNHAYLAIVRDALPPEVPHLFAGFGAISALLGAAIGLVQVDARRAAIWLLMSQTGLVTFGLENHSIVGLTGALLIWVVSSTAISGFAMTIAALEARRGFLTLKAPGGSFERTPFMAVAFLLMGFASVGFPLTLGFVAEDLLVQGSIGEYPYLGLVLVVATALNGINVMRCFFTLFSGTRDHLGERDLTMRERVPLALAVAVLVVGGALPGFVVRAASDLVPHTAAH